jgi:hypothetical protein
MNEYKQALGTCATCAHCVCSSWGCYYCELDDEQDYVYDTDGVSEEAFQNGQLYLPKI